MLLPVARFAPCGLAELTADGVISAANDTLAAWLGLSPEDLVGRELFEFVEDEHGSLRTAIGSVDATETPITRGVTLAGHDGARAVVLTSRSYITDGERRVSVVFIEASTSTSASEQEASEWDLARRVNARLQMLVETAASFGRSSTEVELGQHLVDAVKMATGADEVAAYLLGGDESFVQLAGSNPLVDRYPIGAPTVAGETLRSGDPVFLSSPAAADAFLHGWNIERVFRDAGVHAVIVAPIVDQDRIGAITAFFHNPVDIDDQVLPLTGALARQAAQVFIRLRLEAEMRRAANRDIVTGLANRRLLEERSTKLAASRDTMLAAIFLDLDKFKQVNDEQGHDVGDRLLEQVGRRISSIIRDEDAVARYGGDEFVAICAVPDERTAVTIAERVREAIAQPYEGVLSNAPVRASVGVAIAAGPVSVEHLIRAADVAMYEAKTAGGNMVKRSAAA